MESEQVTNFVSAIDAFIDGATIVGPMAAPDDERWYLMASNRTWYLVCACCRHCATRNLNAWVLDGQVQTQAQPDWLILVGKE